MNRIVRVVGEVANQYIRTCTLCVGQMMDGSSSSIYFGTLTFMIAFKKVADVTVTDVTVTVTVSGVSGQVGQRWK